MINIRPISDLRNRFSEIEHLVLSQEEPVFLTKNGYGSMVVMSLEQYAALTDPIEQKLDEADQAAEASPISLHRRRGFSAGKETDSKTKCMRKIKY